MAQMGHTSSALALEVYAKVMERKRDTGERMDALIRGADWPQTGTNDGTDKDCCQFWQRSRRFGAAF
jgi:hypothetical protein